MTSHVIQYMCLRGLRTCSKPSHNVCFLYNASSYMHHPVILQHDVDTIVRQGATQRQNVQNFEHACLGTLVLLPLMAGRALSVAMLSIDSVLHTAAYLTDKWTANESISKSDLIMTALQDNIATVRRSF